MSRKTSPKTRGTNFERRVSKWLQEKDWRVFRSAGSRTSADLIALMPHKQILAVQCKASHKPVISKDEKAGLIDLIELGARSLVICRDKVNYALKVYELVGFEDGDLIYYDLQMTFDWP